MNNEIDQTEQKLVQELKTQIGFKTAFKATLGFYAAQALVGILGLLAFGTTVTVLLYIASRYLTK